MICKDCCKEAEDPQDLGKISKGSLKILKDLDKILTRSAKGHQRSLKILKDLGKICKGLSKILARSTKDP